MRTVIFTLFLALALPWLAGAQENNGVRVVAHRSWAGSDMVKPIHVEIKIRNDGKTKSPQLLAELTLTPDVPRVQQPQDPPVPDNTSPVVMIQVVPSLAPGQSMTLDFITVYHASEAFSSTTRFYASGVLPDDFRGSNCPVHYKVDLHE